MLIRTLALLTRFRGANDDRSRAPSGHDQPLSVRPNGTSGDIQHCRAARSRVRVAVGAQVGWGLGPHAALRRSTPTAVSIG
jgi:hypothetical protein